MPKSRDSVWTGPKGAHLLPTGRTSGRGCTVQRRSTAYSLNH